MADNSVLSEAGQAEQQFRRMAGMIRCVLPGVIVAFDPAKQRCQVQPGIRLKSVLGVEVNYVDPPIIDNVPIVIPYGFGGKMLLTHPISAGDPCSLIISDRAVDFFLQTGQLANPCSPLNHDVTTVRSHHLSDALCLPGLICDPQVVPAWNNEAIELRNFDRTQFISLGTDGINIQAAGVVNLTAPNVVINNRNFMAHTHENVQPGTGASGGVA